MKQVKLAIIGGGITGLSAAFYYLKQSNETEALALIESSEQFGGKIRTFHRDGFTIEGGPDSFIKRKPEALELIEALGLSCDLTDNHAGQSFILKNDQLHPIPKPSRMGVPTQLQQFLASRLLSEDGKALALNDFFIPPLAYEDDISVGSFFEQRVGREMVEDLISPLLSGIYAGDIDQLSMKATLPQFLILEKKYGSLIEGLRATSGKAAGGSQFATLKGGLGQLVDALVDALQTSGRTDLRTGTRVDSVEKSGDHYELILDNQERIQAEKVVITTPPAIADKLLGGGHEALQAVQADATSVATVAMAFPEEDVAIKEDGTGFVVSRREQKQITATTWTHLKWPHTAPVGYVLLRCYVGKAGDDSIIHENDDTLVDLVLNDLKSVTEIKSRPLFSVVTRWPEAMPQYKVGHLSRLEEMHKAMQRKFPGVELGGAAYGGIGLPDCIKQAKTAVSRTL